MDGWRCKQSLPNAAWVCKVCPIALSSTKGSRTSTVDQTPTAPQSLWSSILEVWRHVALVLFNKVPHRRCDEHVDMLTTVLGNVLIHVLPRLSPESCPSSTQNAIGSFTCEEIPVPSFSIGSTLGTSHPKHSLLRLSSLLLHKLPLPSLRPNLVDLALQLLSLADQLTPR